MPWLNTMPPGWLQALGVLGRVGQGYMQGQQQGLQNQYLQQQLQQQQQKNNAAALLGLVAQQKPITPFAPDNPTAGLGGAGAPTPLAGLAAGAGVSQPQMPTPPPAAPAQGPMTGGTDTGYIPLDPGARPGGAAAGLPQVSPQQMQADTAAAPPSPSAPPVVVPPSQAQAQPQTDLADAHQKFVTIEDPIDQFVRLRDMVAKSAKGTKFDDPATIGAATMQLYPLIQRGDQNALRFLAMNMGYKIKEQALGERTRHDQATEGLGQQRVDVSRSQGAERLSQGQERLSQGRQRLQQSERRMNDAEYNRAYARGTAQQKAQIGELHRQLADIDRRITQITNAGNAVPDALNRQRDQLAERERALGEQMIQGTPAPSSP